MNQVWLIYFGAATWGLLLGLVYFGGLWLTVKYFAQKSKRALWFLGSFFVRNAILALGLYPVVQCGWQATLICLGGMLLVRIFMTRRLNTKLSHS